MRIGIVNDSRMAAEVLRRVVLSHPDLEVAWVAVDGEKAAKAARENTPDLVLMDLIMPNVDGVEATRLIMEYSPCPILIVTATMESRSAKIYQAMGHGALDVVTTPVMGTSGSLEGADALLKKIQTIARLKGIACKTSPSTATISANENAPAFAEGDVWTMPAQPKDCAPSAPRQPPLLVIGASTGGPQAIAEILGQLSSPFPAGIVIVQHVDAQFAEGMASWLNERAKVAVSLAQPNCDASTAGQAFLAATNDHLLIDRCGRLSYSADPADYPYRPSVDVLFRSVATHWHQPAAGVLLTGMGRDGAEGLLALRQRGWLTIAQDEASSVVYGMPRAAAKLDAAEEVLPLSAIANRLNTWARLATAESR